MATIANDYAALLLYDRAQELFSNVIQLHSLKSSNKHSYLIAKKATHILAVLSFAEGNLINVRNFLSFAQKNTELVEILLGK